MIKLEKKISKKKYQLTLTSQTYNPSHWTKSTPPEKVMNPNPQPIKY
jgi:hypothetical protein